MLRMKNFWRGRRLESKRVPYQNSRTSGEEAELIEFQIDILFKLDAENFISNFKELIYELGQGVGSAVVNIVFTMSSKRFAVSYNFEIRYDFDKSVRYICTFLSSSVLKSTDMENTDMT